MAAAVRAALFLSVDKLAYKFLSQDFPRATAFQPPELFSNSGEAVKLYMLHGHYRPNDGAFPMYKQTLAAFCVLASVAGCSTTPENPVDFVTYRNEPLVKQVEKGMTMQQVITIGGSPSTVVDGTATSKGGTCNNYILNKEGKQQPYYVTFDSTGHVDSKGFMTCAQHATNQKNM